MNRQRLLVFGMPLLALAWVAALVVAVRPGLAYVLISRWGGNSTEWSSSFQPNVAAAPFPAATHANVQTSGARWSSPSTGRNFNFIDYTFIVGPTRVWIDRRSFAAAGWPSIPGQTQLGFFSSGYIQFASVYLNSDWSWNTNCGLNQAQRQADVLTIILHEMGHAVALNHDINNQGAVMWPNYVCKQNLTADDRNGIGALYP